MRGDDAGDRGRGVIRSFLQQLERTRVSRPSFWRRPLALVLAAGMTVAVAPQARAADTSEFWPELSAFIGFDDQTRVYLDSSYAKGLESEERSLDLGAYLDVSLMPIVREELRS